jgi:hypothetical protein
MLSHGGICFIDYPQLAPKIGLYKDLHSCTPFARLIDPQENNLIQDVNSTVSDIDRIADCASEMPSTSQFLSGIPLCLPSGESPEIRLPALRIVP